jgi:hypothetical protein
VGETVDISAFEDLLDRKGENPSQWHSTERRMVHRFLAEPAAWAVLDEALALRAILRGPAIRAPSGLADRIFAQAALLEQKPEAEDDAVAA